MNSIQTQFLKGDVPAGLPVTQVYGFCFDNDGRVLVIADHARMLYELPGGKPELGETNEETLRREVTEEAQTHLGDINFIGYQMVEGDDYLKDSQPYAQVRAIARIKEVLPAAPDPATGLTFRRFLCPARSALALLGWDGPSAAMQVDAAIRGARELWAISSDEAPMVSISEGGGRF
jgi:8-oxo-dGTP pyrophosphatase MutT (NUDIX family)